MKKILYISLTGMTEPLGRSQVLEYIIDLSKENKFYLISFERENDIESIDEIKELIKKYDIEWHYFIYSNKYGVFSTVGQIFKVFKMGAKLIKRESIQIIHARSMIPATIGMILKKVYGVKLLFDIRGFAIDEKVDSKRLKNNSFLFKILKFFDNYLYKKSDHIVVLTYKAKEILNKNLNINISKITVIPTCVSKNIFKPIDNHLKLNLKKELGFQEKDLLIIHTGTVLNRYDFDAELRLFCELNHINRNIKFIILNKGEHKYIKNKFNDFNIDESYYKVLSVDFTEVYKYLNISDFSLFFIPPTFAKSAMAPTKFAENVICYLPSITNTGVGDMDYYIKKYNVGYLIELDKLDKDLSIIAKKIVDKLENKIIDKNIYNELFSKHFDKNMAVVKYQDIYNLLVLR